MRVKLNEPFTIYLDLNDETKKLPEVKRALAARDEDSDELGDTLEVEVPTTIVICGQCSGKGTSSLYLGVFSGDRLDEARNDHEFWEDYTSGRLDRPCETCGGTGRMKAVDEAQASKEVLKAIKEEDDDRAYARAEQRAEMGMGYGREEGWYD